MKLFIPSILALLFVNLSFGQVTQNETLPVKKPTISTAIVGIDGMACQEGCADKISANLLAIEGVVSATVSYDKKEAVITFDPNTVTAKKLETVITDTKVKEYVYTINTITIKEEEK